VFPFRLICPLCEAACDVAEVGYRLAEVDDLIADGTPLSEVPTRRLPLLRTITQV